jgi:hypothetical protein
MPCESKAGSTSRAACLARSCCGSLDGFKARLLTPSNTVLRTRVCCQPGARAAACPGLLVCLTAASWTHRGSDDSSGPQLHASEEWRARPVAPKTAGRESSLSAININWPQSHEDRDARRQSDQDASRRRLLAPVTRGPGTNSQGAATMGVRDLRDPRQVPLLQLPKAFDDGRNPSPYSKRKQQNVMFPWDKKKPITRDMQERVMAKLIANGCKKKRRKRTYFSGSAPSDLDLLIREEKRKPGPNHYHVREDSTIARVRVPVMGRLNLSSTEVHGVRQ